MTQKTENKPTPIFHDVEADPSVAFPELTGGEPCRTTDPDSWFPEQGFNGFEARQMCRDDCPVLEQCRNWALANPHLADFGIWGGMSRSERRAVRRRGARTALTDAA